MGVHQNSVQFLPSISTVITYYEINIMEKINVLIIDENILVRRAITTILQKHEQFQVFWINDAFEHLVEAVEAQKPDIILLSVENLNSDGLEYLQLLQSKFNNLPIIVISPRSNDGAKAAITALRLGAVDFITKPEHKNLILFAERHLEKRLGPLLTSIHKIHQRSNLDKEMLESLAYPQKSFEDFSAPPVENNDVEIITIGGCTGGIEALFSVLGNLPADISVPLVIVQHLPRTYTSCLAKMLDAFCDLNVKEVQNGEKLMGGKAYIAPGGFQCEISHSGQYPLASIYRGLRENNMRPSIDVLFRSASKYFGEKTLGILLSGCGYDGLSGASEIRKHNGQFIVQDPRTAIASELPLSAIKNGLTKEYYAPKKLAAEILKRTRYSNEKKILSEKETVNSSYLI